MIVIRERIPNLPSKSRCQEMLFSLTATRLYFPDVELYENKRINAYAGMRTTDLFSPRARVMISHIWDRINSVNDLSIRAALVTYVSRLLYLKQAKWYSSSIEAQEERPRGRKWVVASDCIIGRRRSMFEVNAWNCSSQTASRAALNGTKEIAELEMAATEKASVVELVSSDVWIPCM